jgi:lipopolysaccharide export system permease protein
MIKGIEVADSMSNDTSEVVPMQDTSLINQSADSAQLQNQEPHTDAETSRIDSDSITAPVHSSSTWFFDTLTHRTKKRVLNAAQDMARKNKDMFIQQKDELEGRDKQMRRFRIEWHRKFYLAAICIVLFFIGSSLGAIVRKGGFGLPILMAIVLFVVYHLLTVSGERMAKSGILEPWQGMWLSTIILLPLAIWLTYKAANDSVLLDRDAYSRWFRKLLEKMKLTEKKAAV